MCCAAAAPVLCCNAMYCFNALCRFADAVPTLGAERFVTHASAGGVIWAFPVCLLVCLVLVVMAYVCVRLLVSRLSPVHDRWRLVELHWYIDRPHAPAHICTGTWLTLATFAPGLGSPPATSSKRDIPVSVACSRLPLARCISGVCCSEPLWARGLLGAARSPRGLQTDYPSGALYLCRLRRVPE